MRVRLGTALWVLEALLALAASLPAAVGLTLVTGHLPASVPLATPGGGHLLLEAVWTRPESLAGWFLASAAAMAFISVLVMPLVTSGVVARLGEKRPAWPEALAVLRMGLRRYPRYLLAHVLYLVLLCAAVGGPLWAWGYATGTLVAGVLVVLLWGARDLVAVMLRTTRNPIRMARMLVSMVMESPVGLSCGFVIQALACSLLVLLAARLQLMDPGITLYISLHVLAGVQALLLAKSLVRVWWLHLVWEAREDATGL